LTDRLTDEAIKVIDHAGERPFFLYLAHHAPHTPIEAKAEDVKHFEAKLKPGMNHQNAVYAAMIKSFDESVGRVLEHLKERGLEQNTVVVFASDNGGYIGTDKQSGQKVPVTNNAPLRSGKGACYEGGIRVPLMIRWPGVTVPGAESHEPVAVMDLVPTLLKATGTALPPETKLDGMDLSPLLKDANAKLDRDALFWHYPHYYETTTPVSAIRARDWKLLEYFQDNHVELYNLKDDLGEKTDLAKQMPEKANELRQRLHQWRDEVGAAMPTPNPDFKGKR
jgi:arylsulfatase A